MKTSSHQFLTTRWTLVGEASAADDDKARDALQDLFSIYWKPLYRYVRRRGKSAQDAEDIVQGFFAHLIAKDGIRLADRDRGRFRTFLLGSLNHFMANEWRKERSQKRGGNTITLSLDWEAAETGFSIAVEDKHSPDRLFDEEWAVALLEKVLADLEQDEPELQHWRPFLAMSQERLPYTELARDRDISEGAARVAVHRLRKRYRQRLRSEIADTLSDPSMVDEEMQALFSILTSDSL
jgi:RNA polymerase sigma-70 factor (ECF subfamily)